MQENSKKKYDKEKKLIKYIHSPPGRERGGGEEKEKDSHAADEKN